MPAISRHAPGAGAGVGAAGVLLGLALLAGVAHAHAVLTRSSLEETPVKAGAPTTVTLRFNSAVEPGLTRVVLVNAQQEEQPLTITGEGEPRELRVALPALRPGPYGLRYKVLAADGHVTENVVRFTVAPSE